MPLHDPPREVVGAAGTLLLAVGRRGRLVAEGDAGEDEIARFDVAGSDLGQRAVGQRSVG